MKNQITRTFLLQLSIVLMKKIDKNVEEFYSKKIFFILSYIFILLLFASIN